MSSNDIYQVSISAVERTVNLALIAENTQIMRQQRKLQSIQYNNFDTRQITETLGFTTQLMTMQLAAVAGVSLLIGGIGIMNIMLVSVTERTREISIVLAVGATASEVLLQLLVEAVTPSCISGIAGIAGIALAFAFGLCYGLENVLKAPFNFNTQINVVAFAF